MTLLNNHRGSYFFKTTLADYSKSRLLSYADSFRELADCMIPEVLTEKQNRQETLEQYREWERKQILCRNMKEISDVLAKVAVQTFSFSAFPDRWCKKVVQALRQEKIEVLAIYKIWETAEPANAERYALGVQMSSERPGGYSVQDVSDMLSVLIDKRLKPSVLAPMRVDREEKTFVFVEEPVFLAVSGYAKAVKENETISGDNHVILETAEGELSVLVADGMGSGEIAGRDSERVLELMEKFLETGMEVETSMQLVNNMLMVTDTDNLSTLDVCTVDLYTGMCRFRKAGAATTFLKSNRYVEQIKLPSLPMGIFRELECPMAERELIQNDYVILVTDGVVDALEENGYEDMLQRYLEDLPGVAPTDMAQRILQFVLKCSGGRVADDMTVVVVGIYGNY